MYYQALFIISIFLSVITVRICFFPEVFSFVFNFLFPYLFGAVCLNNVTEIKAYTLCKVNVYFDCIVIIQMHVTEIRLILKVCIYNW